MSNSTVYSRLFGKGWYDFLEEFIESKAFGRILKTELNLRKEHVHYPSLDRVFRAFTATPLEKLSVIFVAQDPYYNGRATGLATGIEDGQYPPPTLVALIRECVADVQGIEVDVDHFKMHYKEAFDYSLVTWADQGMLLLNRALSVRKGVPESNLIYWRPFTDYVIQKLSEQKEDLIFVLLGRKAQEVGKLIDSDRHDVIEAAHPAAESYNKNAGFYGSKIFTKINHYLEDAERTPIEWMRS